MRLFISRNMLKYVVFEIILQKMLNQSDGKLAEYLGQNEKQTLSKWWCSFT